MDMAQVDCLSFPLVLLNMGLQHTKHILPLSIPSPAQILWY